MCEGSKNSLVSPLPAKKDISLQGQACLFEIVYATCEAPFRICITSLVTMDYDNKAVMEKIQRRAVSMVSGLKGESKEEKLEEERRHHAEMLQPFKIVRGIDRVDHNTWFQ